MPLFVIYPKKLLPIFVSTHFLHVIVNVGQETGNQVFLKHGLNIKKTWIEEPMLFFKHFDTQDLHVTL